MQKAAHIFVSLYRCFISGCIHILSFLSLSQYFFLPLSFLVCRSPNVSHISLVYDFLENCGARWSTSRYRKSHVGSTRGLLHITIWFGRVTAEDHLSWYFEGVRWRSEQRKKSSNNPPPWEESKNRFTICVLRDYTGGSATDAIRNGGTGVYIQYPDGHRQMVAIPTNSYCTNLQNRSWNPDLRNEQSLTEKAHTRRSVFKHMTCLCCKLPTMTWQNLGLKTSRMETRSA